MFMFVLLALYLHPCLRMAELCPVGEMCRWPGRGTCRLGTWQHQGLSRAGWCGHTAIASIAERRGFVQLPGEGWGQRLNWGRPGGEGLSGCRQERQGVCRAAGVLCSSLSQ